MRGRVKLWGRVIEAACGLWAEIAYPAALVAVPPAYEPYGYAPSRIAWDPIAVTLAAAIS